MKNVKIVVALIFSFIGVCGHGQVTQIDCSNKLPLVNIHGKEINWDQFPNFSLPFIVVYHGPSPANGEVYPLRKGFSHIQGNTKGYKAKIPYQNRVYLWTGIVGADGWAKRTKQPWIMIKSPWGNDIEGYREKWWNRIMYIKNNRDNNIRRNERDFDRIILDLEKAHHSDKSILAIKNHPLVPQKYQKMSEQEFINEYKLAMTELYNEPFQLLRDSLPTELKVSSYGETPIRREWWGINKTSWDSWRSSTAKVDYLVKDRKENVNSNFYNSHSFISPTAYYFYDPVKHTSGDNYLAYLLFQIEANKAWSNKEQLLFVWLNYHNSSSPNMDPVGPEMAEATAIFPLISGVGIYNWRMNSNRKGYYEYFIRGLYRMSMFNDFFDGNQVYVIPEPAQQLFSERKPVWRAVVNGNRILIAAQNPYAESDEITQLPINFQSWSEILELRGTEVFLCSFSMN